MSTADLKSKLVELRREIDRELRGGWLVPEDIDLYSHVGQHVDAMVDAVNYRAGVIQQAARLTPAF